MSAAVNLALGLGGFAAPIVYQRQYGTLPVAPFALAGTGLALAALLYPEYETPLVSGALGIMGGILLAPKLTWRGALT